MNAPFLKTFFLFFKTFLNVFGGIRRAIELDLYTRPAEQREVARVVEESSEEKQTLIKQFPVK